MRLKDKEGNWHYLESKANIAGREILLISRDITKRKETENELLKTKAFLEASINQSSAGILIADAPDVTIRYANPAALGIRGDNEERLTGIAVEDHVKQWQTYYPNGTEYNPEELPLSKAILKGEIVRDEEVIIRDGEGIDRYVLANASPVRNESGDIIAGVVVFSDISDLKKAEDNKRKTQQDLIRLNDRVFEMIQLTSLEEMYHFIGTTLTDFIDDAVIITGDFNTKQDQVTVKDFYGLEHQRLQKLLSLLKVSPIGKTYPLKGYIKKLYENQKLFEIEGGLSSLAENEYSSFVIKKVERLLNLKKVYTIGLRQQDRLYAWVHIFKFNEADLKNRQLVELFLSQSSLLLQQKYYEEKNKELAKIVKQSDDSIIQTNASFEIIYMNPKAEELYGYTLEEVLGKTPEIFNAEKTALDIQQKIYESISKGNSYFDTFLNKRKNGEIFWCQMKITPLIDDQNKIYGYISSQRDISEQKKNEEEQMKLHQKSLFLSKTANELQRFSFDEDIYEYIGTKIKELAGNCIIFLSKTGEKQTDFKVVKSYGDKKILGKITNFIGGDLSTTTLQSELSFVEKYLYLDTLQKIPEKDFKNQIVPKLPKGAYLFAKKIFNIDEIYVMSLKNEGIIHGSVIITAYKDSVVENTDIIETFLNQAAVALQRNNAMKDLSEMNRNLEIKVKERTEEIHRLLKQKDEFINQLGHDLKNPLGPLVNLLPIVENHTTNPKDKKILQVTQRNVKYMKNLVQKTLELARLNSPNATLSMISINVYEQIQEIIERNKYMFNEKQITVSLNVPTTLWAHADLLRFEELVNNLLNNSVKYNDKQGHIHIEAFEKDEFITISIHDDGIGMDKEQLNHIFDEFYKADESRHDFDSSGLGMPICKRIVEKHGGTIWAESDGAGKGSTISFTLPKEEFSKQDIGSTHQSQNTTDQSTPTHTISEKVDDLLSKRS